MKIDPELLCIREEIRDVTLRYARGVDRCDWELVRSCYHADAYDDHGTYKGGISGFIDFFSRQALHFSGTMHVIANFLVDVDAANGRADAETYCIAHHWTPPGEDAYHLVTGARYVDRFELREAEWRIAHRRCVLDWSEKKPARSWGLMSHFIQGERGRGDALYHPGLEVGDEYPTNRTRT